MLDSHAILHRAYHALPEFTSTKGEPTGALYGLCLMLLKIINELKPNYIIACFDFPTPTHRHDVYEGYKANRPKTDKELIGQIIRAHDVFKAFNIPIYEIEGFEADDLLGTIAEKLKYEKTQKQSLRLETWIHFNLLMVKGFLFTHLKGNKRYNYL